MSSQNNEYNHSKYTLGITELYWDKRHGNYKLNEFNNKDDYYKTIRGYLFMHNIYPIHFIEKYKKYVKRVLRFYYYNTCFHYLNNEENHEENHEVNHNTIRNFENIISNKNNYKVDIVEKIQLEGLFTPTIAIIKTHYLRLIQRKWKSIFKKREEIIKKRMMPHSLKYREMHGVWPTDCIHLPTISSH